MKIEIKRSQDGFQDDNGTGPEVEAYKEHALVCLCLAQNEDKWKNTTKWYTIFILLKKEWREYYFPVSR